MRIRLHTTLLAPVIALVIALVIASVAAGVATSAASLPTTAAATTTASTTAAAKPAKHKRVFWIDLAGAASQHPRYVYFTANSGGYVKNVTWTKWGKKRTVGKGTFGTTAPCGGEMPPCPDGPAKMVLRKPVRCTPEFGEKKGKTVRVYRHARITYPDGEGGTLRANISDRAGWATCKQSR